MILLACLPFAGKVSAQRYLPGQTGIQVGIGAVDGVKLKRQDGQAYCFGVAISTYTKNGNRWVFGAGYLEKKEKYAEELLPATQITAEGGYFIKLLSSRNKVVFLSAGISALAGYETVNWGRKGLKDGAVIESTDNFIYGPAATLEAEVFITDRVAFLLDFRERCMMGSSTGKFHAGISLGCKYIFN